MTDTARVTELKTARGMKMMFSVAAYIAEGTILTDKSTAE